MAINLVVAVTDYDWYRTLSQISGLREANFWAPTARSFRALQPGELFLFKLPAPHNKIVGGGIFAHSSNMPWPIAWEAFGEANGAHSPQVMRERIANHRPSGSSTQNEFEIGCRILTEPFFFAEADWIDPPISWAPNIMSFKTFNTGNEEGLSLWQDVHDHLRRQSVGMIAETRARYGEPYLVKPRLGQGGFRLIVTDIYERRCAITRERTLPALDAAHIHPYEKGGPHETNNGLLLRRDIHKLFDDGYVTVTPDFNFEVSRMIREEFENGRDYYALHGTRIQVPKQRDHRPEQDALMWHNNNVFKG